MTTASEEHDVLLRLARETRQTADRTGAALDDLAAVLAARDLAVCDALIWSAECRQRRADQCRDGPPRNTASLPVSP